MNVPYNKKRDVMKIIMQKFKGVILATALFAMYNTHSVDMLVGAPVPTVQGANYYKFSQDYKGYLINQQNQIDPSWVSGAVAALQRDGLYNSNNFLNILWNNIEQLTNYYAQGNQAFKNATRQSLENVFKQIVGYQAPQVQPVQQPMQPSKVVLTLRTILDGVLGQEYASKANEIYRYDFSKAKKRGEHSLADYKLSDAIKDANANPSTQNGMAQLKLAIDNIYTELGGYKMRDSASISTQSSQQGTRPLPIIPGRVQALSIDSILGGTLGEPYTSKANEIYNSGVIAIVEGLKSDLNRDINAGYTDQNMRIDHLKASIDKLHRFLEIYRKNNPIIPGRVQALSIDSILGGTLGEPYTSKANDIYNSGVTTFVEALKSDLNRDINAGYTDQNMRIDHLKASIDRLHRFLENYRKNKPS
jgi:hypothetical protein